MGKPFLLVLLGPTAAGKSQLALHLAPRLQAEIVTADSAQIYRGLDIGTAKPTREEQQQVPHHLIDLVEPDQDFSVAQYQEHAYRVIDDIHRRGKLPFLVGGTGLYISAVVEGYALLARGKNPSLRMKLEAEAEERGLPALHRELAAVDPQAALKIHPHDRRRILRALEVYRQDRRRISEQVEETRKREKRYDMLLFGLTAPRDVLYTRIDRRVEEMLQAGFLAEVQKILAAGYSPQCRGLQVLGYRQLTSYLLGETTWEAAVEEIKRETRRLAKRQMTWFRRNPHIVWLEHGRHSIAEMAANIYTAVEGKLPAASE